MGDELGFDTKQLGEIIKFLLENELIELSGSSETFGISNTGIEELKEAIANPYRPTKYSPPLKVLLDINPIPTIKSAE